MVETLSDNFYNKWIKDYPGFWLNAFTITIAIFLVLYYLNTHQRIIERKIKAISSITQPHMKNFLMGKIDFKNTYDYVRRDIRIHLFKAPEDASLLPESPDEQKYYDEVTEFLDNIRIRYILRDIKKDNYEEYVREMTIKSEKWLASHSAFITNKDILFLWSIVAITYVLFVGFAYFGEYLKISKGEPILNIIDIGIYLCLIEYTGSSKSPILYFLCISILAAALDLYRIHRHEFKLSIANIRNKKWKQFIRATSPSMLYFFALTIGIIWAFLDEVIFLDLSFGEATNVIGFGIFKVLLGGSLFIILFILIYGISKKVIGIDV